MLFIWSFYSSKNPEKNVSCFQIKYWGAQLFLTKTWAKDGFQAKDVFYCITYFKILLFYNVFLIK